MNDAIGCLFFHLKQPQGEEVKGWSSMAPGGSDKCQIKYKNQKGIKKKNRKENKSV